MSVMVVHVTPDEQSELRDTIEKIKGHSAQVAKLEADLKLYRTRLGQKIETIALRNSRYKERREQERRHECEHGLRADLASDCTVVVIYP